MFTALLPRIFAFVRLNVAKATAPFVIAFAAHLAVNFGVVLPEGFASTFADLTGTFVAALVLALVGVVERLIATRTNPRNVASDRGSQ